MKNSKEVYCTVIFYYLVFYFVFSLSFYFSLHQILVSTMYIITIDKKKEKIGNRLRYILTN